MNNNLPNRHILCIDLKSFFASVECVERNLDPYKVPLVVCNPHQVGAITLAVTPYLKKLGVNGRCRVYDLPKNIHILKVPPRMRLYQEKSKEVLKIYLDYIAPEDMHVYSIDEAFLDVTAYLKLYKKTAVELAQDILNTIYQKTGLTATSGIGPNMLLAKVAMDIEAKHIKNNIASWTYDDVKTKLWTITPLSKMCGIGSRLEKRLNALGLHTIGDIAHTNKELLRKQFGVIGEELWNHANGIDFSRIRDLKTQTVKEKSISHSQILFKDYYAYNISLIIYEMIEVLCRRLRHEKMASSLFHFGIGYSKSVGGGFYHSMKLDTPTDDVEKFYQIAMYMFDRYYKNYPIRKVSISFGKLTVNNILQLNLFENMEEIQEKKDIYQAIDEITSRYGPNTLLKASSLLSDSTIIERNQKIGGHNA